MPESDPKWSKSILVVEDDDATRVVLMASLQQAGYNVTSASGRTEVMALVRYAPIDLVLTDMLMPDLDGAEVIKAVRRYRPGTPVLTMSGDGSHMDSDFPPKVAESVGPSILLVKPFHLEELLTAVEKALNARHADSHSHGSSRPGTNRGVALHHPKSHPATHNGA
ncbi:MAG: response regulator [Opitutaceae bacterium]